MKKCPCGSGLRYASCCQRLHDGSAAASSALELMRSRYSAYALNQVEYIIETTHSKNPNFPVDRKAIAVFCKLHDFIRLEILDYTENEVTFKAHLRSHGQDASFTEKSFFQKENGKWRYLHGEGVST